MKAEREATLDHLTPEDQRAVEETGSITEWILGESLAPDGEALPEPVKASHIAGVAVGVLVELTERGARVDFVDNPDHVPISARATLALTQADVGREVALMFEGGKPNRPIVMGLMHAPAPAKLVSNPVAPAASPSPERLVFSADKEIVFRCGKSSITLTRAGKILLRGAYLLADSSGVNRIRGGTVEIN